MTKVLIVEDSPRSLFMLGEYLSEFGLESDGVEDAAAAIELVRANPRGYCVILMDIHLPEMNGLEAAEQMRNVEGCPPVIAVTGDSKFYDRDLLARHGIVDVVGKPLHKWALFNNIRPYLPPHAIPPSS